MTLNHFQNPKFISQSYTVVPNLNVYIEETLITDVINFLSFAEYNSLCVLPYLEFLKPQPIIPVI